MGCTAYGKACMLFWGEVSTKGRKNQGGELLPICLSKSKMLLWGVGYYWKDLSLHLFEEFLEQFFYTFHHFLDVVHMEKMPAKRTQGIRQIKDNCSAFCH